MKTQSPDTHPEVERVLMELVRTLTAAQKMERMVSLNRSLRQIARAQVRRMHPNASEHEVALRTASRWLPRELMVEAFGWDPATEGY